jgi:hypothetical protein
MPLIENAPGGYRFLEGIEPYSSGVVAAPGYEIVHASLPAPLVWREGFLLIEEHLRRLGRERAALCAVELRSPRPFTRAGFVEFNGDYVKLLDAWGLLVDGRNPIARTNVAPARNPPPEPSLFAFSYTVPAAAELPPTFVVAGAGDLRGGPLLTAQIVRPNETGVDAMVEKAAYVLRAMTSRLEGLGVGWGRVTTTDVYTVQPLSPLLVETVADAISPAAARGICCHFTRPPIEGLEFEMDVRGVRREEHLPE